MATMSLRLADEKDAAVKTAADAYGITKADFIRESVDARLDSLKGDPEFKKLLQAEAERHARALELLA